MDPVLLHPAGLRYRALQEAVESGRRQRRAAAERAPGMAPARRPVPPAVRSAVRLWRVVRQLSLAARS
jgi:hypothetical protein